jgi:hypothetical protein
MSVFVVPNIKCDMDIVFGTTGWTESHYYTVTGGTLYDAPLQQAAFALAQARCIFLDPNQASIADIRLSVDATNRDATHVAPPSPAGDNGGFYPGQSSAFVGYHQGICFQTPQVSWPVMLRTQQSTTRPIIYLGGFPGSDTLSGPYPTQDGAPTTAYFMDQYLTVLTNGLWGCKARLWQSGSPPASKPLFPLTGPPVFTAGVSGGPGTLFFPLASIPSDPYCAAGGYLRLSGQRYTSPQKRLRLNGTYQIAGVSSTSPNIGITVVVPRILVSPAWIGTGFVQIASPGVLPYLAPWAYRKLTHKKRGRVTGAPRGRR